jgi:hypothetical protein
MEGRLHTLHAPALTEINTAKPAGVRLTEVWPI